MAIHTKPYLSPEQYLALERTAETKSEYLDGEMIAMTGASRIHNLITLNVGSELRRQLRERPCEVHVNDMRVVVAASQLYTYPDVIVICGEPVLTDDYLDTLSNPTVLLEVLSPSTESYDRGRKFDHYRTLDSLREYLLVAQDRPHVEQFIRQENGKPWLFSPNTDLGTSIVLPSIGCELAMSEIYSRIPFGNQAL